MRLQTLLILAAVTVPMTVAMALAWIAPVMAAPVAQTRVANVADVVVDEVVVTAVNRFTLTVKLDEVTMLTIPLQVNLRADGPVEDSEDEILVSISPTVLKQGVFSVTVGAVEPTTGTLAIVLAQPVEEVEPVTATTTITGSVPATNTPTANTVSNLRAGPSTDFAIVGSAEAGDALDVIGQNSDGTWLALANGTWIAAFLVDNVPDDLPVMEPPPAPTPTIASSDVLTTTTTTTSTPIITRTVTPTNVPTNIPTVTPTP